MSEQTLGGTRVMLGNGDGGFSAATNYGVAQLADLQLADMDGDGNLDLVNTTIFGNVSVLLSNGDGSFQARECL